jgi:hypothetical protein
MTKLTMMATSLIAFAAIAGCDKPEQPTTQPPATDAAVATKTETKPAMSEVERGRYIVTTTGCHDCHTPPKMGEKGPEPDMTLALSGHPASMELPPPPKLAPPWLVSVAGMTAWAGPWGVSYAANITSDPETGIGKWTRQNFIDTIRNGRHLGNGRETLPPMPWPAFREMTDEDLGAIYEYLKTVPPLVNRVPDPLPPPAAPAAGKKK